MPFHFTQYGRSPLEWSLLPEHQQTDPACEDWTCYCIQLRVTIGEGRGDQTPPPLAWICLLIANMFQDRPWRMNYRSNGLGPQGGDLILWSTITQRGASLGDARDAGFCLGDHINLAGREALVKTMMSSVQESHWAISNAAMIMGTKARVAGHPKELWRQTRPLQQHTTLKSGIKALKKMLPKWSWEMTNWVIMGLSKRRLILSICVEVVDGMEVKVPHDYWQTLLVDPINQPWLEGLGRVTEQEGQEEVWGWWSICQSSRMKRPRILRITIPGSGM